jgi:hypothetical protein
LAGVLGAGAGCEAPVTVVVGAGPEAARVVVVAAARVVTVVGLAARAVVAVLEDDPGTGFDGTAAAMVAVVVAAGSAVELVVLGGPALANSPPRRNDGGPLCVSLYPATPAARSATEETPATIFTRLDGPRDT